MLREKDALTILREGRASLRHLERAIDSHALAEADAKRWIKRMNAAFDQMLGPPPPPPPVTAGPFTVHRGGRA